MSLDDLLEVMNQAAIWIAKKDYKNDFWKAESFLKVTLPKWKKWQKAWKNRITYYTPRVKPATHSDVAIDGVIEEWDPKKPKGTSQIKTIMVSPMFGPEIVALYKKLNEKYDPAAQIKSKEAAESLRQLLATDIKFMIGCDHEWDFSDDDEPPPAGAVLRPAAPTDDAGGPQTVDPAAPAAVDPRDITKWDVCDLASIPLSAQDFDENNITANRCYHAATLLIFMSDEMERLHPDVSRVLHAGFQKQFMHAVDAADMQRPPSVGTSSYTPEEVRWCQATFDFLEGQLDEDGRAKRNLPPKRRGRGPARGAAPRPAPAPPAPPAPAEGPDDTENDDDTPLRSRRPAKRGRKSNSR